MGKETNQNTLLYGALTINDYKFKGRAWEIDTQTLYDVLSDQLINVQIRDNEVLRVLPYKGGGWISDYTRFYYPLYRFEDLRKIVVHEKQLGAWWLTALNIEWLFFKFLSIFEVGVCVQWLNEIVDSSDGFTIQVGRFEPIGIPSYVLWIDNIVRLCGLGMGALCYNPVCNILTSYDLQVRRGFINTYYRNVANIGSSLQLGLKVIIRGGLIGLRERSVGVIERMAVCLNVNGFFDKDCELFFNWQNRVLVDINTLGARAGEATFGSVGKPFKVNFSGFNQISISGVVQEAAIEHLALVLYENGGQPLQLFIDRATRGGTIGLYRSEFLEMSEFLWDERCEGIIQQCIIQKPPMVESTTGVEGGVGRLKVGTIVL